MSRTAIDRREDGKNKSAVNRQRFIRRFKNQIRRAVVKSMDGRSITDIDKGEESINIPARDLQEPVLKHGSGGRREAIHPGNREFVTGDQIARPLGGSGRGSGSGQTGNSGEGEDDFVFELRREEFLGIFFEGLELPFLEQVQLAKTMEYTSVRAGFSTTGSPMNIDVTRSYKKGFPFSRAMTATSRRELGIVNEQLFDFSEAGDIESVVFLLERREEILAHIRSFSRFDPSCMLYKHREKKPKPTTQAVMFCIMDVSGSMDKARKDLAKQFFSLLYLFLKRSYERIEVVFIRHHTVAKEVDEQEFFYGRETGGTIVSGALTLMEEIQKERYPVSSWNLYVAQASDGDNWPNDSPACRDILARLLERFRYGVYVEITPSRHQSLWEEYEKVKERHPHFAMRQIDGPADIYPVFRDLFKKRRN